MACQFPGFRRDGCHDSDGNVGVNCSWHLFAVQKTVLFDKWLRQLPDRRAAARTASRVQRLEYGRLGYVKQLADTGLEELRLDYGPGYRL